MADAVTQKLSRVVKGKRKAQNKAAEGIAVAMVVAVPMADGGAAEDEVAGVRAGGGVTSPVVAVGAAVGETTVDPGEVPAPGEGERYIFYQSV